jgi:hypothetical protein
MKNKSKLRVGFDGADEQRLYDGLEVLLGAFELEFVNVTEYTPSERAPNGQWSGSFGWLQNHSIDTVYWTEFPKFYFSPKDFS